MSKSPQKFTYSQDISEMINMTTKCYYNIPDGMYYVVDEDGFIYGIGATIETAIENAEFHGADCNNIEIEEVI